MLSRPLYISIMLAAFVTAALLARRRQSLLPLTRLQRAGLLAGAFVGAMLGAKLPYVVGDWEGLASGRAWLADGKTILFGLVGGYAGVEVVKWALDLRLKTGDAFAVPVAAAIAIGRLGCFVAGCCHGIPTELPWGVRFADGVPRHPTQLYEAAFHGVAALCLIWIERRGLLARQRIKLYILAYLVFRLLTELLRPEPRLALGLTFYQWSALLLIPLFVVLWRRDARGGDAARPREAPA